MKNLQSTNGGFILTSISFKAIEKRNNYYPIAENTGETMKRIITKYDYCLPPEEKDPSITKKITLPI